LVFEFTMRGRPGAAPRQDTRDLVVSLAVRNVYTIGDDGAWIIRVLHTAQER
jgi:hypothetical protein